jgi:hypothetical protein
LDQITKSPIEKFPVYFNFSNDLIAGETITSFVLTSINATTGESSASDRAYDAGPPVVPAIVKVIDSSANQTPDIQVVLKDGVEDDEHQIQCVATTNNGNTYQRDLLLAIHSEVTDSFTKQPGDTSTFDVDFTRRLGGGDTVTSSSVVAIKESDGLSASVTLAPAVVSPKVGVPAYGGTDGETYRIGIRGATASGYIYEKFVRMNVQEF